MSLRNWIHVPAAPRTLILAALPFVQACAAGPSPEADNAAIQALIAEHYVDAVFSSRDEASVRSAFHPGFQLFALDDGTLLMVSLDAWMDHLELDGVPDTTEVRHEVVFVDVSGDAAVARTELFVGGEHVYTDYFSLYRVPGSGWQVVSKIFQSHDDD
ncbi:MAG TPA: nuclear transport factor 2 family protein [Longimicrobiales bacterium]|nr:nuclear transport factor 2 family protein [Longimicrobiales bacterium]